MTDHATYRTAVRNLQRYLRRLSDGSDGADIFAVPIDGIFGTATADAVSEYQRRKGLGVTGRADKITWDTLFAEYLERTAEERRKTDPDLFPAFPDGYETEFGETGAFITMLQFTLDELRQSYDTLPGFAINGTFDGDTSLAVKEFQRIHSLPMTGRVNRRTWNEIAIAYNRYGRYGG